jgi:hypothetical protein
LRTGRAIEFDDSLVRGEWLQRALQLERPHRPLGCNIEDLPKLHNLLVNSTEANFEPKKIVSYISRYESLSGRATLLDDEARKKTESAKELELQMETSRGEFEVLQAGLTNLKTTIKNSREYVEDFKQTTSSLKDVVETSVEDAKTQIKDLTDSVKGDLNDVKIALSEAKPIIQDFSVVVKEADEVAAMMAKESTILPLLQMIKEGKGSAVEVFTSITLVLDGLEKWLKAQDLPGKDEASKSLAIVRAWAEGQVETIA